MTYLDVFCLISRSYRVSLTFMLLVSSLLSSWSVSSLCIMLNTVNLLELWSLLANVPHVLGKNQLLLGKYQLNLPVRCWRSLLLLPHWLCVYSFCWSLRREWWVPEYNCVFVYCSFLFSSVSFCFIHFDELVPDAHIFMTVLSSHWIDHFFIVSPFSLSLVHLSI